MSSWLESAKNQLQIEQALPRLGLDVVVKGGNISFACPSCCRERRSSPQREKEGGKDHRGACRTWTYSGIDNFTCSTNGGDGCGCKGTVVDLVAWVLTGAAWDPADRDQTQQVRAFFGRLGVTGTEFTAVQRPPKQPPAPPKRVPVEDLATFWGGALVRVDVDRDARGWLVGEGYDCSLLAEHSLCKALPRIGIELPNFAHVGRRSWAQSGHRIVTRAYEADATRPGCVVFAGVHARRITPGDPKTCWPTGFEARGLLFCTGEDPLDGAHGTKQAVICEGFTDFLAAVQRWWRLGYAVIGTTSGSATLENAKLIPAGWTVYLLHDRDAPGEKYRQTWRQLLEANGVTVAEISDDFAMDSNACRAAKDSHHE